MGLPTEPWALAQGEHDGTRFFVRINTGARAVMGHAQLSSRLGIAVPLRHVDENGFPVRDESSALEGIEEALSEELQDGSESLLVLVITGPGFREFVFYTQLGDAAKDAVERVAGRTASHELQFIQAHDPQWDVYGQFSESAA